MNDNRKHGVCKDGNCFGVDCTNDVCTDDDGSK